jgi:cytochrome c556
MKFNKLIITFLSSAALVVGCNKEATTSEQLDTARAKTAETAQEMKDYSYAQKSQFVEKMQGQLAALNHDLDQLAAKIERSSEASKAEAKPKLQKLRDQTGKLNQQLEEVKNATASTWDSVKTGFNKAYNSSKDGFQEARQWVSDKSRLEGRANVEGADAAAC